MNEEAPKKKKRKFRMEGFDRDHAWMTIIVDAGNKHKAQVIAREAGMHVKKIQELEE